jgi:GTPase SAR1 family protein
MKEYQLGPNGAILTALNLFLSQPEKIVDQMKAVMGKHEGESSIFVIDIPGQIEVFTWSSSSLILVEAISTLMPIKIVYIIDSVRCNNPNIFLSNILFARSYHLTESRYSFGSKSTRSRCC